ncbi:hypothetical protein MUK70_01530 [Dyadobacter chenwenxiniae]|uniref:Uncharacterized protein n=1 Tax=Dyadobacter chenwenxiniae TaxID=2906456 RepID=A0A9X1PPS2_9BACT|nr:hypothetical protein [Dyadobacter chenwenxiniae]MCF0062571.1 hypothetical protein [Dyadobacter chenwenxiniae]UON83684.1 hypothetical protein MUK70_01530 [Dyadobacter chenwenxiniae]
MKPISLNLVKSPIVLLYALLVCFACKHTLKEPIPPRHVSELLGIYQSKTESKDVYGGTSVIFIQMEIKQSATGESAVDLTYIQSIKRYKGTTELVDQAQTWGPWNFKGVTVNDIGAIDHKETQYTNFGGQPGESIETILSVKGGLADTTLTLMIGTNYPSKNLFTDRLIWLERIN